MNRRPSYFLITLFIWLGLETAAFWLVASFAGIFGVVILCALTTFLGIAILRQLGRGAADALRNTLSGGELPHGKMLDGALTALGAILLILPGFVSDLAGMGLAAPSFRQWLGHRFGGKVRTQRPNFPNVVDLSPSDWKTIDGVIEKPKRRSRAVKPRDDLVDTL